MICNKLVRDKIPKIYEADGKTCITENLQAEAYAEKLIELLDAELNDFKDAFNMEDDEQAVKKIADIVEVLYAVLDLIGVPKDSFEKIRLAKNSKFGGYKDGVLLKEIINN